MTKKIFSILIAVMVCLSMAVSASAYTQLYIYDPDFHLTEDEKYEIDMCGIEIERATGYAVLFGITSQTEISNEEYVESVYANNTDTANGIAVLHNTEDQEYYYYIAGDEKGIFNDDVIDAMITAYNASDSYYGGLMGFYAAAETALEAPPVYNTAPIGGNAITNNSDSYVSEFEPIERTLPLVVDAANIIPDDVEKALIARCETMAEEYKMEVAIVTTSDFGGLIAEAYADDFYDFNGYGYGENDDGMLVVYKPGEEGEREIYITTHGNGSGVFFQGIREGIIADMKNHLIAEDYEKAFNTYLDRAEAQLKPGTPIIWLFVLALVGAVVGLLITGSMTAKNKSVIAQNQAKVYTRQGSMNVTDAQDVFAYSFVNTTPKQTSNSNDDSTHTSSSGRTHNGSGAKF